MSAISLVNILTANPRASDISPGSREREVNLIRFFCEPPPRGGTGFISLQKGRHLVGLSKNLITLKSVCFVGIRILLHQVPSTKCQMRIS